VGLLILSPSMVLAQEVDPEELTRGKVTSVFEGQPAPFSGVLLSQDAAASLFGDIKFSERECQLRLDRELQLNTVTLQAQIEALTLRLQVEEDYLSALVGIKNQRIEFLEENWTPESWYESGEFWLSTGVVVGIVVTVAAGYALGQAAK
jgi:hypothetical protein